MLSLQINKNQFSDLLNLNYGVFLPLKNFVNEKNFKNILIKKKIGNKFFPIPIFFGVKKNDFEKIKNKDKIKITFRKKLIAIVQIKSIFKVDHKRMQQ